METKKTRQVDLETKKNLHFTIGLVISISLVTLAFEWRTLADHMVEIPQKEVMEEILPAIQPTRHEPPKPKMLAVKIKEIPDEEDIDEVDVDIELPSIDESVDMSAYTEAPPVEEADEILIIAEVSPSFPGGLGAFYEFVGKHLKYPRQAIKQNVEGKVFVEFVVDTDGSLSAIKVSKGIGAGCDEEALRVLKSTPRWTPGKQRGRAVKVRMTIPITFKLQ